MRRLWISVMVIAVMLVPAAFGVAVLERDSAKRSVDQALAREAVEHGATFDAYFERARAVILLTANAPAFRHFYEVPGTREQKIAAKGPEIEDATAALAYLERLYPQSIGEACFIDRSGAENARVVKGTPAHLHELAHDESANDFFGTAFALPVGQVHQTRPYVSPDTDEWVIANATPIPGGQAIVHFEVTIESFRQQAAAERNDYEVKVVDARTGDVVIDSVTEQRIGAELGVPADASFRSLTGVTAAGTVAIGGRRASFVPVGEGSANANDWLVVAVSRQHSFGVLDYFNGGPIGMLAAAALLFALGLFGARVGNLRSEAHTDHLTGLPNRRYFLKRLDKVIASAETQDASAALLVIDLDRFKDLNDTLGHHAGDRLLEQLGPRLLAEVRDGAMIARLGGDEFAVLIPGVTDRQALEIAHRLRDRLQEPVNLEGLDLQIDGSIGIALYPEHGTQPTELLQRADIAMYKAKRMHTGCEVYAADEDGHSREQLALGGELRDAIRADRLTVYYQPKADLQTGHIDGVEALVRWVHPVHGLLAPGSFLAVAEQIGLMRSLTSFVLDRSLRQTAEWAAAGRRMVVSVNVGPADLMDERFPDEVAMLRERHGVPAELLQLEVTENTIMSNPERILGVLGRLADTGVTLSLDDYGTGHSSLSYLKRLPIHELKIDRSFVFNMDADDRDATIVRSTIDLAKSLSLRVVAEGVETEDAWNALAEMGAEVGQGYLLARPLPADELDIWLANRSELPATV